MITSNLENEDAENSWASVFLGVPLTYKSFCGLIQRVSSQGPPKPLPSLQDYLKSCVPPILSDLGLSNVNIGPPSSLQKLNIKIDKIPLLGDHITNTEAEKWEMLFPGGETAGLARLERMVSTTHGLTTGGIKLKSS